MGRIEIEYLVRLPGANAGSRTVVEDGPGIRQLEEKGRVRVLRELPEAEVKPATKAPAKKAVSSSASGGPDSATEPGPGGDSEVPDQSS